MTPDFSIFSNNQLIDYIIAFLDVADYSSPEDKRCVEEFSYEILVRLADIYDRFEEPSVEL